MLDKSKLINYFIVSSKILPPYYIELETNHLMIVYFIIVGLDLLDSLHEINKENFLNDIYSYQINYQNEKNIQSFGFHGYSLVTSNTSSSSYLPSTPSISSSTPPPLPPSSSCSISLFSSPSSTTPSSSIIYGNLAMTYTALVSLITLEDTMERLHIEPIIDGLKYLQLSNGSFKNSYIDTEGDVRFTYCAIAIIKLLKIIINKNYNNNIKNILLNKLKKSYNNILCYEFLLSCQSYEGGFGINTYLESQGGATYCAVASLLMIENDIEVEEDKVINIHNNTNIIDKNKDFKININWKKKVIDWCINRHRNDGVEGRTNKTPDSCYTYWIDASLSLLGISPLGSKTILIDNFYHKLGGFSKYKGGPPDIFHTFYGIAWLSLINDTTTDNNIDNNFNKIDPYLAIRESHLK